MHRDNIDTQSQQPDSSPPLSSNKHQHHIEEPEKALLRLIDAYNEVYKHKQWMVSLGEPYLKADNRLLSDTHIINGPAQSGKTSLVYWSLRNDSDRTAIATIDCSLYRTDVQFIQKLTREVGHKLGVPNLDHRAIASENIKFHELNQVIRAADRPLLIIIRNAERLVELKKQILLYNLLEWIATDIKKYVGLVFTTRLVYFVDKFEKRVRSRLAAKQLTVTRPSVQLLIDLLARRVQCLCLEERELHRKGLSLTIFEKLSRALRHNRKVEDVLRNNQQFAQKDIVYYLNAMKVVLASFQSGREIAEMKEIELQSRLAFKLQSSFEVVFPFMPRLLLKTCTFPEYIVMAIIHYMAVHDRVPFRFKTVYEIYLEFKQRHAVSQQAGSAFIYSKKVLERAVLKLQELRLIELGDRQESVWNCDIVCSIYPQDIERTFKEMRNLPVFLQNILQL